jgi:alkanesulfonate monooxygenase SsuD/methylene tetrahydromethanopterin reductase-like flavin-dependent oxidoreductase (luciferase family)
VKACFAAFRSGTLDHHGDFYDLDFITPQWSPGPIDAPDPKVDVAAVNPWMLRMAGEVADGVHVHPVGEPGYLARHVVPNVADGAAKARRSPSDIAIIVPVMTIVGDSEEERDNQREVVHREAQCHQAGVVRLQRSPSTVTPSTDPTMGSATVTAGSDAVSGPARKADCS